MCVFNIWMKLVEAIPFTKMELIKITPFSKIKISNVNCYYIRYDVNIVSLINSIYINKPWITYKKFMQFYT